jgi:2Fe-2S ferredoxin
MLKMTFIDPEGNRHEVDAPVGATLLEIARQYDIEVEGACDGSLSCSTCHVVVDSDAYERLRDPDEDEQEMLDLAFGLRPTSRLGCQIIMGEELDGLTVTLPARFHG